ncbi:MAG: SPOR domain-containing protein [Desulfobacteraceae bacterium]|jgi:cell division septation protein DedD
MNSLEDTDKAAVQNVFKNANQEYKNKVLWEKIRQGLNPVIFTLLILMLVILSVFTGTIMDSDSVMKFFNMKNTSASIPAHVSIRHTNKRKVSVSKAIKDPSPEKSVEGSKTEKTDIHGSGIVKEETESQATTDTILLVKTADEPPDVVKEEFISYPYSVYLGSYSSFEKVETALSVFSEKEITTYWIKLDLGEKGIWFRHFAGYFKTRDEADEFIKNRQLKDAESRLTKYTNLIGIYRSKEDMDIEKARIEELGYSPYIISDSEDVYRLYAGAFYQKGRAEELKADLELNGVKSELVER